MGMAVSIMKIKIIKINFIQDHYAKQASKGAREVPITVVGIVQLHGLVIETNKSIG